MFVTLDDLKRHLRITTTDEDPSLTLYGEAACEYVNNVTGQTYSVDGVIPFSIQAAALLVAADLYEHRESELDMQTYHNQTVDRLLAPYRLYA